MDKKILTIMVTLVVVALLVVGFVMWAAGGSFVRGGGFSDLFDDLEYEGNETYGQELSLPDNWDDGDKKKVSDVIVDMAYRKQTVGQTSVYITTLWFVYVGDKWSNEYQLSSHPPGTLFYVPSATGDEWIPVDNGIFHIEVSSATNISAEYDIGETITVESLLEYNENSMLAFGTWKVSNTI